MLDGVDEAELAALADMQAAGRDMTGYQAIQGTRPQTLAYGLHDSPVGLAGWLVEKYRAWSDCDGDVEVRFTRDELLTQITTYWVTETINSADRLYREAFQTPDESLPALVEVPTGHARFPAEGFRFPRAWIERLYPGLCHWTDMPSGGHFAAMEEPALLVDDLRTFFRPLR
jgi:microsomal epoxide hydrolase